MNLYLFLTLLLSLLNFHTCKSQDDSFLNFEKYHSQEDLTSLFDKLVKQYPNHARVGSIGKSSKGKDLKYIEISHNVLEDSPLRPKVKLVGNMHGDETVGREILIYFAQYLLHSYDTNTTTQEIINNTRLYILPTMNPDGFEIATEGSCDNSPGRSNGNRVDLNRDFPDQFQSEQELQASNQQPETMSIMQWIENNK